MLAYSHKTEKGKVYWLHSQTVTLRGSREQTIYYFSGVEKGAVNQPPGTEVVKGRAGLPVLRKKR